MQVQTSQKGSVQQKAKKGSSEKNNLKFEKTFKVQIVQTIYWSLCVSWSRVSGDFRVSMCKKCAEKGKDLYVDWRETTKWIIHVHGKTEMGES